MKLLIANRGEIAVRIIRCCREMGISPVAVYSEADRQALHVKLSDEAHFIGPAPSRESYLSIERILEAAGRSKADAVHPGYGFLAENESFARACRDDGLVFVGPSAESIQVMGDKVAARRKMIEAGVPVIPGSQELKSLEDAVEAAAAIGYPVMLKASAGGGGKGMRVCGDESELRSAYRQARSEAQAAFGDPAVFLEKRLRRPRHIEVQVLGDQQGRLIHLGERECSIQRRHQKIVEECPSPLVGEELRRRLGQTALKAAAAVGYFSAGTVEMLVDDCGDSGSPDFYFLEMNTRLQVEHPVTEMVTGVDLVEEQIRIARGEGLRMTQDEVSFRGAAIECRVYAEDPYSDFFPSPGVVSTLFEPAGPGIRVDSGVCQGFEVPLQYDPLISKLVAHGRDRNRALARMRRALGEYRIGGVETNLPFFQALLDHPEFVAGRLSTDFIERHGLLDRLKTGDEELEVPLAAAALDLLLRQERRRPSPTSGNRLSEWRRQGDSNSK